MTNQITQKFTELLGPITDDRLSFGLIGWEAAAGGYSIVALTEDQRQQVEQLLIDYFKFNKVIWMEIPAGLTEDGEKAITAKTTKLGEGNITYGGKTCYMYQILFTPKIYDPISFIKSPVKDGCTVSPVIYNTETFTPYRNIVLTYDMEYTEETTSDEDMKQYLRNQLEKVLANPKEYIPEGTRGCMLRFAVDTRD